jgi:4-oxalmesaconate hydratase
MPKIIDSHTHWVTPPPELGAYRHRQIMSYGRPTKGDVGISDDQIVESLVTSIERMDQRDTSINLFSPMAVGMGHQFGTEIHSRYWTEHNNDLISRICKMYPDRFIPVCSLPQSPGVNPANCIEELERCVNELGFIGCNINPDPAAGGAFTPSVSSEWWYPLYEKMIELNVPGMMHGSATVNPAHHPNGTHYINTDIAAAVELLYGDVFDVFPKLKLIIPHGGGVIPYQWGRYRALSISGGKKPLEEAFGDNLFFDSAVYDQEGMELLIKRVGVKNVLFASELMGTANPIDPNTNARFDDTKVYVDNIDWLTDADKDALYEGNVRRVYPRIAKYLDK